MNNIGTKEIKTKRLLLRAIKKSDYTDMYGYTVKEEVAKYVSWSPHENIEQTRALCKMWQNEYKNGNRYNWAIVFECKVIGNIDVVKIVDSTAHLGWQIDSDYWNKGIVTEAAIAVRDYMFSKVGVEEIEAAYIKENIGSGRVMQKIGMTEIPVLQSKRYQLKHETQVDGMPIAVYKLTKEEWEKIK